MLDASSSIDMREDLNTVIKKKNCTVIVHCMWYDISCGMFINKSMVRKSQVYFVMSQ